MYTDCLACAARNEKELEGPSKTKARRKATTELTAVSYFNPLRPYWACSDQAAGLVSMTTIKWEAMAR